MTPEHRLQFHAWLLEHGLDPATADAILATMAPFDWHELATKSDLQAFKAELVDEFGRTFATKSDLDELKAEFAMTFATKAEMTAGFTQLRNEMRDGDAQLRDEMRDGDAQLRREMNAGFAEVRTEIKALDVQLRQEMNAGFGQLRLEMGNGFGELRRDMRLTMWAVLGFMATVVAAAVTTGLGLWLG